MFLSEVIALVVVHSLGVVGGVRVFVEPTILSRRVDSLAGGRLTSGLGDLLILEPLQAPHSVDLGSLLDPGLARLVVLPGETAADNQQNLGWTLAVPISAVDAFEAPVVVALELFFPVAVVRRPRGSMTRQIRHRTSPALAMADRWPGGQNVGWVCIISRDQRKTKLDAHLLTPGFLGLSSKVCRIGRIRIQVCRFALGLALALGRGLGRNLLSRAGSRERLGGIRSTMLNKRP